MAKSILVVLTSHDTLGRTGKKTGFHWEELSTPYWQFRDAGHEVHLASINGGEAPAAPPSPNQTGEPVSVTRFRGDETAMGALRQTKPIDQVVAADYDAIYLPGGHGTMWDTGQSEALATAITTAYESGAVVGAVCHGPAGLTSVTLSSGQPLVKGKRVNSFTDAEKIAIDLQDIVPYMLETKLTQLGAHFEGNAENFKPYAVRDGRLVTGQNPSSSEKVGSLMLEALAEQ